MSFRRLPARVIVTLPLVALVAAPAFAGTLAPSLLRMAASRARGDVHVIVETVEGSRGPESAAAVRMGARGVLRFDGFPGYRATLPLAAVRSLSRRAGVRHVSLDETVRASGWARPVGYGGPADHTARAVGADVLAPFASPQDEPAIAVLDTGVAPVPGLRLVGWFDAVKGLPSPYDDGGHGTHVAGIAAGEPGRDGTFSGTCPGAAVVGVKVLNAASQGLASDVIRGIDWCIARRCDLGIGVINLSLGQTVTQSWRTDPLCRAVGRAVAAGIVVVAAAGNQGDGYGGVECPGNSPAAITVGAMRTMGTPLRSDDRIASFSSRGPTAYDGMAKPDLLAPGNRVVSLRAPGSLLDTMHPENRVLDGGRGLAPSRYFVLSGTSMSAPVVAGIAARVLGVCPSAGPNTVKAALMLSAQRTGGWDPVLQRLAERYDWMAQGAGYVNAPGASVAAMFLTGTEPHEPALGERGQSFILDESISWGDTVVWGRFGLQMEASSEVGRDLGCVLWGDGALGGDDSGDAEDVVDGTCVLWGDHPVMLHERPVYLEGDE